MFTRETRSVTSMVGRMALAYLTFTPYFSQIRKDGRRYTWRRITGWLQ